MNAARIWLRLRQAGWVDGFRAHPGRRTLALLLWWVPWVLVPAASWASRQLAEAMATLLVSVDVPLTLVLGGLTTMGVLRARERAHEDDWLWPARPLPRSLLWMHRLRVIAAARWGWGLALGAALLWIRLRGTSTADAITELWVMSALALVAGWGLAWLVGNPASRVVHAAGTRRARGLAALSWAPLHEARSRLALRRLPVLVVPALLAAPAGAQFRQAMEVLLVFVAVLVLATLGSEARHVQAVASRWLRDSRLPRYRIAFWTWRHVATGALAVALLWMFWPMPERAPGAAP